MKKNELTKAMKEVIAIMISQIANGINDEEIIKSNTTEKIGDRDCTPELLIELLSFAKARFDSDNAAAAEKNQKNFFGNKDPEHEYPRFPKAWENSVIIRESVSMKVGPKSKDVVEVPSSVKFMPYDKSLFDTHVKNGMFHKKNVVIIHDPR